METSRLARVDLVGALGRDFHGGYGHFVASRVTRRSTTTNEQQKCRNRARTNARRISLFGGSYYSGAHEYTSHGTTAAAAAIHVCATAAATTTTTQPSLSTGYSAPTTFGMARGF